ncbi:MAG: LytR family transcriptional regulator, partial [Leifsonia sp.]
MRRPNFPASGPGADGSDQQPPATEVFGRVPPTDPRRPVRATRPASGVPTGGGTPAPFDPFGLGGDAPGLGGEGAGRNGGG